MSASIYARKSSDQSGVSDDQKSVARQVDHARQFAASKGWTVDDQHVYIDDGISGAEFANRPGFLRMMNALKPRAPFQVLVMSEESRLGREAIETGYALKQLISAGVRVFFYLDNRERTLDSPTEKFMMSLTGFTDELEREKARQRTYDAMSRKAKAGHVTGGACFGYRNVDVLGPDGRRSHVRRTIEPDEAAIIQRIFALSAEGYGVKTIAKRLNNERAPSPRAQRGRSQTWAPSSVREVLYRELYRGVIVWNQTRKRDRWGQQHQTTRPTEDWVCVPAPDLRIVTDEAWHAAHASRAAVRAIYLKGTNGRPFGRPPLGNPSPYLLTNLATCGQCGGPMRSRSRKHGTRRAFFYGCAGYHERGRAVCANGADVPMADADGILIEALLDDVLDLTMINDAIEETVAILFTPDATHDRAQRLEHELGRIDQERSRLVSAIAAGGTLAGLLEALQERERTRTMLVSELEAIATPRATPAASVRADLMCLAQDWRRVLVEDPANARPIVSRLLDGRVTITPFDTPKRWQMRGTATLSGLFYGEIFPSVWRPQQEATPAGIMFSREFRA